jgi:hypothetical protein
MGLRFAVTYWGKKPPPGTRKGLHSCAFAQGLLPDVSGKRYKRKARSPPQAGMRPSPQGDAYNKFPYNTTPQGLMRPSPNGDAYNKFPYSTDPKGLMRPSPNGDAYNHFLKKFASLTALRTGG